MKVLGGASWRCSESISPPNTTPLTANRSRSSMTTLRVTSMLWLDLRCSLMGRIWRRFLRYVEHPVGPPRDAEAVSRFIGSLYNVSAMLLLNLASKKFRCIQAMPPPGGERPLPFTSSPVFSGCYLSVYVSVFMQVTYHLQLSGEIEPRKYTRVVGRARPSITTAKIHQDVFNARSSNTTVEATYWRDAGRTETTSSAPRAGSIGRVTDGNFAS